MKDRKRMERNVKEREMMEPSFDGLVRGAIMGYNDTESESESEGEEED
jgi:hypothetical protein